MDPSIRALGWTELDGRRLTGEEVEAILLQDPEKITRLGGNFSWNGMDAVRAIISGLCRETAHREPWYVAIR